MKNDFPDEILDQIIDLYFETNRGLTYKLLKDTFPEYTDKELEDACLAAGRRAGNKFIDEKANNVIPFLSKIERNIFK